MPSFVLIHGGAHGPWCWERLIPYLRRSQAVDAVVAVDLIADAQATEPVPANDITSAHYVNGVVARIEQLDLRDILLVGHSMAGITVPALAHRLPDRVRRVIYLASSNPVVSQSIAQLMEHPLSPLSRAVSFEEMFCNDLGAEDAQWLLSNLRADPPIPFSEPVLQAHLPAGIPSTYVVFEKDRALPEAFQLEQACNARVDEIRRFDAGHSGYISRPEELAKLLLEYAQGNSG